LVGGILHDLEKVREDATASASLLAAAPAASIAVPVIGVPTEAVADTFGAPRGTDRRHEGVDIFAPRGTYVTSATEGIVVRIGTNQLGGNIVFVLGPGGERYYYAHLDEIDPLLAVGQRVGTTTVLGRVGTTGNAIGTPPHLHFGIYGQGGAKDPYERLTD
jgi:murein DD-endopeptidase MepM/ murein hydrolase activator NlpD